MSAKQQSILLGGAVVAVLSTSYLGFINCLCCAGVIIGAMAAVWHYTSTNSLTISSGEGAVMGLGAAVVGGILAFFINLLLTNFGLGAEAAIQEFILNMVGDSMDPDQLQQMEDQFESSTSFSARLMNGVIGLVVTAIFGAIGGAIGAAVFKKEEETPGDASDVM